MDEKRFTQYFTMEFIDVYETRYGRFSQKVFQLHCLLTANKYQSWYIPTGQNGVDWEESGRAYVLNLFQQINEIRRNETSDDYGIDIDYSTNNLELFTKGLLKGEIVIPPAILYANLTERE